jgi:hypothetical protein
MIKHNKLKVITLHAYDAQGEVVDLLTTQTNMNPELVYLEFETIAMRDYKAVRFVMEVAYVLMLIFFLSSAFARPAEAHNDYRDDLRTTVRVLELHDDWLSGAYCYCSARPSNSFVSKNPPVRYLLAWPRLPSTLDILRAKARGELAMMMSERFKPVPEFEINWGRVLTVFALLCVFAGLFIEVKAVSRLR